MGRDFPPTDLEVVLCAPGYCVVGESEFSSWKGNSWQRGNFLTLSAGRIDVYVNVNL